MSHIIPTTASSAAPWKTTPWRWILCFITPEPVLQALDTDLLALPHDSYIDTELAESLSDLVYHCQLADCFSAPLP
ncbi:Rpn family recombination-promoting nuclease/putative transposase [Oceanobacter sp. 3_MG-2023]|uniref:Rpn family recombination-promoting nuclease/putative transposase n=1 Tax=Oceanobacter sp. 3_MG-2023 TaxID=3062622 RepID=UPI00351E51CA